MDLARTFSFVSYIVPLWASISVSTVCIDAALIFSSSDLTTCQYPSLKHNKTISSRSAPAPTVSLTLLIFLTGSCTISSSMNTSSIILETAPLFLLAHLLLPLKKLHNIILYSVSISNEALPCNVFIRRNMKKKAKPPALRLTGGNLVIRILHPLSHWQDFCSSCCHP